MERYLDGEDIATETLIADLETAVANGTFYPVIPVCAVDRSRPRRAARSADERVPDAGRARPARGHRSRRLAARGADAATSNGPLVAEVVKTTIDPYVGRVSLVRVFSGVLKPDVAVHVAGHGMAERGHADHDGDERITHLYSPLGATLREVPLCVAGDICAITKSTVAETGDTISAKAAPLLVAPWNMPEPLLPVAIVAKTRSDEDAMAKNLARLVAGDPTMRLERNPETHQLVLWCMGEAHADVVLDRLRAGGVELDTEPVRVSLREAFAGGAKGHGRHVKQSGGHGQYAVCDIEVEPLPRGSGFEFVDKVVGGSVPHNYIPSVEKGVRAQMEHGIVAGFPVVDLRVTLHDGKAHSVDSSDAAFQTAGALALKDAAEKIEVSLLEPIDLIVIRVPDQFVGGVLSDLSSRRGRVLGTEADPGRRRALARAGRGAGDRTRALRGRAAVDDVGHRHVLAVVRPARSDAGQPGRPGPQGPRRVATLATQQVSRARLPLRVPGLLMDRERLLRVRHGLLPAVRSPPRSPPASSPCAPRVPGAFRRRRGRARPRRDRWPHRCRPAPAAPGRDRVVPPLLR